MQNINQFINVALFSLYSVLILILIKNTMKTKKTLFYAPFITVGRFSRFAE